METKLLQQLKQEYKQLLENQNLAEAMPLIRQAANWGDVDAQILAKNIFLHGWYHHPITHHAALEYALVAAMNGDTASMYDLAWLYQNGHGIEHNVQKALYWLDKAANRDEPRAMDAYGMLYLQGRVVKKDPLQAKHWFEAAYALDANEQYAKHIKMANLMIAKTNQ